jgi:hypothetical protein
VVAVSAVLRPWRLDGRAYLGGRTLRADGMVAIQSPNAGGWELYLVDSTGLEFFIGYAPAEAAALLDSTLAALLDARSEAA